MLVHTFYDVKMNFLLKCKTRNMDSTLRRIKCTNNLKTLDEEQMKNPSVERQWILEDEGYK